MGRQGSSPGDKSVSWVTMKSGELQRWSSASKFTMYTLNITEEKDRIGNNSKTGSLTGNDTHVEESSSWRYVKSTSDPQDVMLLLMGDGVGVSKRVPPGRSPFVGLLAESGVIIWRLFQYTFAVYLLSIHYVVQIWRFKLSTMWSLIMRRILEHGSHYYYIK